MKVRLSIVLSAFLALVAVPGLAAGEKKAAATAKSGGGPLGDLSPFNAIAKDTLKLVEAGDLKGGKARIKDLETAWDEAEEKMRPLSTEDWETTDQGIDRAIGKLRSPSPKGDACKEALVALIATFDRMQKPKK